jgi:lipopolysaccharide/colanic/teichoic acid biosynthesis glycosyltransferase
LKFRTMYLGSERGVPRLSSADDKRITAVGRTLRKYRLDEIPQFWNILKGEMSIVGPRPERKYYINRIIGEAPYYCLLYKIRPGLTSWGPIKIGYSDTIEKMIERLNYDIIYMENMSLITDAKIILYTLEIILKGKGI